MKNRFLRGDVWYAQHSPTPGHEQRGERPCLIISTDGFNAGPAGLVVACAMTTRARRYRWHVEVTPPEANLDRRGFVMCEQVRTLSKGRFRRRMGRVETATLAEVEHRLRILMRL